MSRRLHPLLIRTPEGIEFAIPLAGPATRFLAWGVDVAVCLALLFALSSFTGLFGIISPDLSQGVVILSGFVINITYNMFMEWLWRGQSLGKRLLGIRVMDVQGLRLHFSQIVLRNLMRVVDALPALYLVGGITMILNRRNQRLGDIASNTVVIKDRQLGQPDVTQVMPSKYNSFQAYPHIEARLRQRLKPQEAGVVIQALLRREELEPQARVRLYARLAEHLKSIAPFPEPAITGLTDEQYLRNVVETLFRKGRG